MFQNLATKILTDFVLPEILKHLCGTLCFLTPLTSSAEKAFSPFSILNLRNKLWHGVADSAERHPVLTLDLKAHGGVRGAEQTPRAMTILIAPF